MKQLTPKINDFAIDTLILGDKNLITYVKEQPDRLPSTINYLEDDQKAILLEHFCRVGDLEIVKYLVSKCDDIYIDYEYHLCVAIENGHLEIVEYFVSEGANIHTIDEHPFWLAIRHGHLDIVEYLGSEGANIHTGNGASLHLAIDNRYLEMGII